MFFDHALLSIANQTCQNFTLYIGDDSSRSDIKNIVDQYQDRIQIVYRHFDENLGEKDLVAQWERCIDLARDEEWIWLFSDDDIMDITCVENFYHSLQQNPDFDLFHFNVHQIDEDNSLIGEFHPYPDVLSVEDFLMRRLQGGFNSLVVEYIFRKSYFYDRGRFQKFSLAWGSDDATWIKLGKRKGIKNMENSMVYWRRSPYNITPNNRDINILEKKFYAQIEYANWLCKQAEHNEIQIEIIPLKQQLNKWFSRRIKSRIAFLPFKLLASLVSKYYLDMYGSRWPKQKIGLLYIYKIYHFLKEILKKKLFRVK